MIGFCVAELAGTGKPADHIKCSSCFVVDPVLFVCVADLIAKLLAYNPDERLSARQALRHPYFRDLRDQEKRAKAAMQPDIAGSYLAL